MRSRGLLLPLSCLLVLVGCASRQIRSLPQADAEAQRFTVLDKDVRRKLVLQSARLDAQPDGRLTYTCTIRNRKDKSLWRPGYLWDLCCGCCVSLFVRKSSAKEGPEWADVKVQWLDEQRVVVEETNWQATQFHRLMDTTLTYSSTRPGVSACRVYMRTREHIR